MDLHCLISEGCTPYSITTSIDDPCAVQVMGAALQMFSMVAGDALDQYLMKLVRSLTSENHAARAILMLQVRCIRRKCSPAHFSNAFATL